MLVVAAPAKVNLALEVVRRRPDGWHEIASVVVPIDWHDLVGLDSVQAAGTVRVTGPASVGVPGAAGAPAAADNLAVRAADALVAAAVAPGGIAAGLSVWVHKRVPPGAGLGGGSADAAAVLRAGARLLREHGTRVDEGAISAAAAALGSDVPALLARTPVHVTGRGDELTAAAAPAMHVVIAFCGPSSTPDAYRALQAGEMTDGSRVRLLIAALREMTADVAAEVPGGLLGSALEGPALRLSRSLAAAAKQLRAAASELQWHMTGSGGAFFALTPDASRAEAVARRLRDGGILARACRTASSPSPRR